ncbi:hypothetical protein AXW83_17140 [Bosea sp. PAMC 26642]|nr:hypothetical protein AXW83_17140 [Bosea sp. PAMC 26642]
MKLGVVAVAGALLVGGCTGSQERVASGGLLGAGAGALIGGAVGGGRGALIGAALGGITGLVIADAIERERARESAFIAARLGSNSQSFRNSSGQRVRVSSRTVRTYNNSSGARVKVVERSMTRDGQSAGKETVELTEVKLASGKTEYTGI